MTEFFIQPVIPLRLKKERFQGTYKVVPKVEWTTLLAKEFGSPNWATLYPLNGTYINILFTI